MEIKFYTHNLFVFYLSTGVFVIILLQFYLTGIDHLLSDFRIKRNRKNLFFVTGILERIHYLIHQISVSNLIKVFKSIVLFDFRPNKYVLEFIPVTIKKTFQNMEYRAEKFFLYNSFY